MNQSPLISVRELAVLLGQRGVSIVDASWHMPIEQRDPNAEYLCAHIPGAVFFDIDAIADQTSGLPHMLAAEKIFGAAVSDLGINQDDKIIVYDSVGLFSAARIWWNFRIAGVRQVYVLDGGLPAWRDLGLPLEKGAPAKTPGRFPAHYNRALVRSFEQMLANAQSGDEQIIDARAGDRFRGEMAEPRAGLASGHILGSLSLPFTNLIVNGRLRPADELRRAFAEIEINLEQPVVTTCGSGVTAAVLALALSVIGRNDVAIYDGSWSEWGGRPESADLIATGK
ncbi:3-mercaptopyruvate sulfurtransferase [Devosia algicola]|uniref:Sulfurtransferase n=1 Tax=Devosia algicola TaxID=3026418 RepID=A0ABY7YNN3_9HYPH|nr:3-mercaptopyruvate sulfurtransferase [Devosia algicola]WDR02680.1 3-mercaptopyruvate sulfurtransferase [Devosia algicola]